MNLRKMEELKKKIDNRKAISADIKMYKFLSRLSGMKGTEWHVSRRLHAGENKYKKSVESSTKVYDKIYSKE